MNLKLASVGAAVLAALVFSACCCKATNGSDVLASKNLPFDMPVVSRPTIPDRSVCITEYGAVPDGYTLCTQAFADAIDALAKQGGGRVIVPSGV